MHLKNLLSIPGKGSGKAPNCSFKSLSILNSILSTFATRNSILMGSYYSCNYAQIYLLIIFKITFNTNEQFAYKQYNQIPQPKTLTLRLSTMRHIREGAEIRHVLPSTVCNLWLRTCINWLISAQ